MYVRVCGPSAAHVPSPCALSAPLSSAPAVGSKRRAGSAKHRMKEREGGARAIDRERERNTECVVCVCVCVTVCCVCVAERRELQTENYN